MSGALKEILRTVRGLTLRSCVTRLSLTDMIRFITLYKQLLPITYVIEIRRRIESEYIKRHGLYTNNLNYIWVGWVGLDQSCRNM